MDYSVKDNITYFCRYHVVWCPKYRRDVLRGAVLFRLKVLLEEHCQELGANLITMDITPDQVRLIVDIDPKFGIHRLVKQLKARTSPVLRQEFPKLRSRLPSLWTNSYFVSTVTGVPWLEIAEFVEQQKNV